MTITNEIHSPGSPPAYMDPDLISLRSAAPSYTSSVPPTYTASLPVGPVAGPTAQHLPRVPQAQQYSSLIPPSPIPTHHQFNVASWPSLSNHSQSRAYLNVAARRARRAQEQQQEIHQDTIRRAMQIIETQEEHDIGMPGPSNAGNSSINARKNSEDALRAEQRSWDFFHAQIMSWEQRETSWRVFKEKHQSQRKKGKGKMRWSLYGRFG